MIYFLPAEYKYTAGFRSTLAAWRTLKVCYSHGLAVFGQACEGCAAWRVLWEPASCKRCSPLSAKAQSHHCSFPVSQAKTEQHEATWCCLESQNKGKKNMAWIEQKSLLFSSLSHCLLHGLGHPPEQHLFKLEVLNFALLVHFLLLSFLPRRDSRVYRRWGIPPSLYGKPVYSARVQVLLPRAIKTSMAVLEGEKGSASCLLFDFLSPCSGRCGCWAAWCTAIKESWGQLSPSPGWWGSCLCQPLQRCSQSWEAFNFYPSLWVGIENISGPTSMETFAFLHKKIVKKEEALLPSVGTTRGLTLLMTCFASIKLVLAPWVEQHPRNVSPRS